MIRFTVSRVVQTVIIVIVILVVSFLLLRAAPGNPAQLQAGFQGTPQNVQAISRSLGLNHPLDVQLWDWLRRAVRGDLGVSYTSHQPVTTELGQAAPATIQLTLAAFILTLVVSIPAGVLAAVRRGRLGDSAMRSFALVGIAVPNFLLGLFLVLIFGWYAYGILPYSGYVGIVSHPGQGILHTLLPAVALAAAPIGLLTSLTRASMLDVLDAQYIEAAEALGVPRHTVLLVDALKNAVVPILTVAGLILGSLLSGAVLVENVFGIPGLGTLLVNSFSNRDYPVAIGVMLVFAVAFVVINLLTDMLQAVADPRVRRSYATA